MRSTRRSKVYNELPMQRLKRLKPTKCLFGTVYVADNMLCKMPLKLTIHFFRTNRSFFIKEHNILTNSCYLKLSIRCEKHNILDHNIIYLRFFFLLNLLILHHSAPANMKLGSLDLRSCNAVLHNHQALFFITVFLARTSFQSFFCLQIKLE